MAAPSRRALCAGRAAECPCPPPIAATAWGGPRHPMELLFPHPWDVGPEEAVAIQEHLRTRVITSDQMGRLCRVGGIDVDYGQSRARAAAVVLELPTLEVVDWAVRIVPTRFPYRPSLLSFRELPAALEALWALKRLPDCVLCDGQGLAHPRRFGLACHLGVLTGLPTVGVAKTRLIGAHGAVADVRGAWEPLWDETERVGAVLRTRAHARPVYVSVGHRVSLEAAIEVVMTCTTRYRLPETTRCAHRLACGADAALLGPARPGSRTALRRLP
jgi:deoxyribonuclease V